MEGYISIREAALKWSVSERRINQYCSSGRILGAVKFGTSWAIPQKAKKPDDPRKGRKKEVLNSQKITEMFQGFMPLMNTAFVPGECLKVVEHMKKGSKKDIAMAEYHYFSGQTEKAMQETEKFLTAEDDRIRLSACWLFAYSCRHLAVFCKCPYYIAKTNISVRLERFES